MRTPPAPSGPAAPWTASWLGFPGRHTPYLALALLAAAVFSQALWQLPTTGDELRYLSSVAATPNPLVYFVQDHGHGNFLYRPLTSVSIWAFYRVFGAWAFPSHVFNLLLHLANTWLLYRILLRAQAARSLALLLAAVFMVSRYTVFAASNMVDRPMALTGLFFFAFLLHLLPDETRAPQSAPASRPALLAALAVLALMGKESGLVVPLTGLLYAALPAGLTRLSNRQRAGLGLAMAAVVAAYLAFRAAIFGAHISAYGQDGYMLLGRIHFESVEELPGPLRYAAFAETVIKNVLAPFGPAFGEGGDLLTRARLLAFLPVIVPTFLLAAVAVPRRLSRPQWAALAVIAANSVVHYALFRYRLQFLSHAAFCLFVAAAPALQAASGGRRFQAAQAAAVLLLLGNIFTTSHWLSIATVNSHRALDNLPRAAVVLDGVDIRVVEQVLAQYE